MKPNEPALIVMYAILLAVLPLMQLAPGKRWPVAWEMANAGGWARTCKSHLKNIGTAAEMYSTDNSGRFPLSLRPLVPRYLSEIPTCPAAGENTYARGYAAASCPDAYTIVCSGWNHRRAGYQANQPQYSTWQYGGLER